MKQEQKDVKLTYFFDPAYLTIYYSFTFLILCLAIIISCEMNKLVMISVILGFIFIIFAFLPLANKVILQNNQLKFHMIFKKDYSILYSDIKCLDIIKHRVVVTTTDKKYVFYLRNNDIIILRKIYEEIDND